MLLTLTSGIEEDGVSCQARDQCLMICKHETTRFFMTQSQDWFVVTEPGKLFLTLTLSKCFLCLNK